MTRIGRTNWKKQSRCHLGTLETRLARTCRWGGGRGWVRSKLLARASATCLVRVRKVDFGAPSPWQRVLDERVAVYGLRPHGRVLWLPVDSVVSAHDAEAAEAQGLVQPGRRGVALCEGMTEALRRNGADRVVGVGCTYSPRATHRDNVRVIHCELADAMENKVGPDTLTLPFRFNSKEHDVRRLATGRLAFDELKL